MQVVECTYNKVCKIKVLVQSGLVDKKVDRLMGQNVKFDILELSAFKNLAFVWSFQYSVFVFLIVHVFK